MYALEDALDEFLLRCQAVSLSPATVRWYRDMCGRFMMQIQEVGVHDAAAVRPEHVGPRVGSSGSQLTDCSVGFIACDAWLHRSENGVRTA